MYICVNRSYLNEGTSQATPFIDNDIRICVLLNTTVFELFIFVLVALLLVKIFDVLMALQF